VNNLYVISAPSGAGKSTLVRALCALDEHIKCSISHTTRTKRPGETDGVDYYFTDIDTFKSMLANNEFIEHALVYDNYYGTHKQTLAKLQSAGNDVILEIDYQGALQIKALLPSACLIYILPPSISELEKRLRHRNTDSEAVIQKRLAVAKDDLSYAKHFDYSVINDNFQDALARLYSIIRTTDFEIKSPTAKSAGLLD
jgi:guanylate kinase